MAKNIGPWSQGCILYQQNKIQTHVKSSVPSIPVPARRFAHVHIDPVGPLPLVSGHAYILTMIDCTTLWPEATSLTSISAESCVFAFISTWISCFCVPALLTSDHGAQFTSFTWTRVCETLKIYHFTTTSFHPQSNGMIERFRCSFKSSLQACLAGQDWVQLLPLVLLGLRTTPKEDSGYEPAEAL